MAAIRSKDTKPEVYLRKLLFSKGYRYRKNADNVYGHPDMWLAKYKTAVFVHGCFWHRHNGCKYAYTPKSNQAFWVTKFENNTKRDYAVKETLTSLKIKQLVIWECTVKNMKRNMEYKKEILNIIEKFFANESQYLEL